MAAVPKLKYAHKADKEFHLVAWGKNGFYVLYRNVLQLCIGEIGGHSGLVELCNKGVGE